MGVPIKNNCNCNQDPRKEKIKLSNSLKSNEL